MIKKLMLAILFMGVFVAFVPTQAAQPHVETPDIPHRELRAYMHRHYMQGLHYGESTLCGYYPHLNFILDLYRDSNQLFKDFRVALRSTNPEEAAEARKTFDYILFGLNDCLTRELRFNQKSIAESKKRGFFVPVVETVSILYILKRYYDESFAYCLMGLSGLAVTSLVRAFRQNKIYQSQQNIENLQKRIEMWSQLLPTANSLEGKALDNKVLLEALSPAIGK